MTLEKEQKLAALLREALKSVTITRGTSDRLDLRTYKLSVPKYRSVCDPHLRYQIFRYDIHIGDSTVREATLSLLRDELKDYMHEDSTYAATFAICGGLSTGSPVKDILKNLAKESIVRCPEEAAKAFYNSIALGYLAFQEYYLLTGIRVEKEVQIFDGISLVPLPNSADRLPGQLSDLFGVDLEGFLSKTLLRTDMSVSPLLHKPVQDSNTDTWPGDHFSIALHSTDITDFSPGKFFQALSLVGEHPVQPAISWTYLSDEHIFDLRPSPGSGHSFSSTEIRHARSTVFSEAQVCNAVDLYAKMVSLPQNVQDQLRIPLDRWVKSKTNQDHVDKMIDLGIALESFYLAGIGERDQLSFRFRLRASLYLGESMDNRKQLIREFREIYDCRSKAVHEGKLPELVRIEGQYIPIGEFITRAQDLCKQSLLNAIENGQIPDWASIELGEENG